jgi:hypothetical protein
VSKYGKSTKVATTPRCLFCDNEANVAQIAAIAVVLVNDRFLASHAYLKDSAVCVRACHLAAVGSDPRGPVVDALRQANLEAGEIQLVEMQGTVSSPTRGLKVSKNGDFDEDDTSSTPVLSPLVAFGTTNLARLCGIGQYTSQDIFRGMPC